MARKLKRYVVGYDLDGHTVFGAKYLFGSGHQSADPLTLSQAQRLQRTQLADSVIYKLVPVREKKRKGVGK